MKHMKDKARRTVRKKERILRKEPPIPSPLHHAFRFKETGSTEEETFILTFFYRYPSIETRKRLTK